MFKLQWFEVEFYVTIKIWFNALESINQSILHNA